MRVCTTCVSRIPGFENLGRSSGFRWLLAQCTHHTRPRPVMHEHRRDLEFPCKYKENVASRRVTIATSERMACDGRDTFVLRSRHIPDCAFVTSECACSNPRCDLLDSP